MEKKHDAILIGLLCSLGLLMFFGSLQEEGAKILELPSEWLGLAIIPLIIALFIGGYIKSFKGFGFELESALCAPVTTIDLTASDVVAKIPRDEKRSSAYLNSLSNERKLAVRSLLFRSERRNYHPEEIALYMNDMPNIRYFEIISENGDIICFLPISLFQTKRTLNNGSIEYNNVEKLITSIQNDNVPMEFWDSAITLKVRSDQSLVDVLKLMRAEMVDLAAVVSPSGKYLGVVLANEIEKKIADFVISAKSAEN